MLRQIICTALLSMSVSHAFAQEGDPLQGRQHAERLCANCHQIGAQRPPIPLAGPSFLRVAKTKGMTGMALSVWFQTSHPTMPNIVVSPEVRADIIAYILSLRPRPQ